MHFHVHRNLISNKQLHYQHKLRAHSHPFQRPNTMLVLIECIDRLSILAEFLYVYTEIQEESKLNTTKMCADSYVNVFFIF
mgnify:CR=1 FL=1